MVDFSDVMPIRVDAMYLKCPVCNTSWYTKDGPYCPACSSLYNEDMRNNILPPAFKGMRLAFPLKAWQKYRMVERLHREGKYTGDQMKKILHDVDEHAINEYNERQNGQKKAQALAEQQRKLLQDLGNRNNYSY